MLTIRFDPFLPEALFSRLVVLLARASSTPLFPSTSATVMPYLGDDQLSPPCLFYVSSSQVAASVVMSGFTLLLRPLQLEAKTAIEVLVLSIVPVAVDLKPVLDQIRAAVETINTDIYHGSLRVDFSAFSNIKDLSSSRYAPSSSPSLDSFPPAISSEQEALARIEEVRRADGIEILSHFMMQKCMVDEVDAKRYSSTLVECGYKGAGCFDMLKNKAQDDAFDVDALIALAKIDNRAFADQIFRELKKVPDVKDPLVLALFDKSFGSETEVGMIPTAVGYKGKCKKMAVCSSSLFNVLASELLAANTPISNTGTSNRLLAMSSSTLF
jgi:hypothetical protein